VSDITPDDHGNKQNRQAGNAWHADYQAVTEHSLGSASVWGLNDQFTFAIFF